MNRLNQLKRFITLVYKNGHVLVEIKSRGRTLKVLSNVHDRLTLFEQDALVIHVYKLFERSTSNKDLKQSITNTNYAQVFGSPWHLNGNV